MTQSVLPAGTESSVVNDVSAAIGSALPIFKNCVNGITDAAVKNANAIAEAILNCEENL